MMCVKRRATAVSRTGACLFRANSPTPAKYDHDLCYLFVYFKYFFVYLDMFVFFEDFEKHYK